MAYIGIVLIVILFSMTLHEAMHAFMGYWLGDDTAKLEGRLTLNPVKHIDPFLTILLPIMLALLNQPIFGGAKPVPFHLGKVRYGEWGAALIAVSGPLTNLLIAFVLFGVAVIFGIGPGGALGTFFNTAILVNLGFFIFNIIPIPPLDGSRVMFALAPDFVRNVMSSIEQYGLILVFAIVFLANPFLGNFIYESMQTILVGFSIFFDVF